MRDYLTPVCAADAGLVVEFVLRILELNRLTLQQPPCQAQRRARRKRASTANTILVWVALANRRSISPVEGISYYCHNGCTTRTAFAQLKQFSWKLEEHATQRGQQRQARDDFQIRGIRLQRFGPRCYGYGLCVVTVIGECRGEASVWMAVLGGCRGTGRDDIQHDFGVVI